MSEKPPGATLENSLLLQDELPSDHIESDAVTQNELIKHELTQKDFVAAAYQRSMLRLQEVIKEKEKSRELKKEKPSSGAKGVVPIPVTTLEAEKASIQKASAGRRLMTFIGTSMKKLHGVDRPEDSLLMQTFIEKHYYSHHFDKKTDTVVSKPCRLDSGTVKRLPGLLGKKHDPLDTLARLSNAGVAINQYTFDFKDNFDALTWLADSEKALDILESAKGCGFLVPGHLCDGLQSHYPNTAMKCVQSFTESPELYELMREKGLEFKHFFDQTGLILPADPASVKVMEKAVGRPDVMRFCEMSKDELVRSWRVEDNISTLLKIVRLSDMGILNDIAKLQEICITSDINSILFYGAYDTNTDSDLEKIVNQITPFKIFLDDPQNFERMKLLMQYKGEKFYSGTLHQDIEAVKRALKEFETCMAYIEIMRNLGEEITLDTHNPFLQLQGIAIELNDDKEYKDFIFNPELKEFIVELKKEDVDFSLQPSRGYWRSINLHIKNKEAISLLSTPEGKRVVTFFDKGSMVSYSDIYVKYLKIENLFELMEQIKPFYPECKSFHPETICAIRDSGILGYPEEFAQFRKLQGYVSTHELNAYVDFAKDKEKMKLIDELMRYTPDVSWSIRDLNEHINLLISLPIEKAVVFLYTKEIERGKFGVLEKKNMRQNIFESMKQKDGSSAKKITGLERLRELFLIKDGIADLPVSVQEKLTTFKLKYGGKGETLIALAIVAYGTRDEDKFIEKIESLERVIDTSSDIAVPKGMKVTMGIEYEIGPSVVQEYNTNSSLGYKADIEMTNRVANIGSGTDMPHEIALKPTDNPYIMLAEVRLLQEAGFMDLNFKKYPDAPRGYHLNLGGESGLIAHSEDSYFVDNVIEMTGLSGINTGGLISRTKGVFRNTLDPYFTTTLGDRIEFKGMATDSVEQFERSVLFTYRSGIAMQTQAKYIKKDGVASNLSLVESLPRDSNDWESFLQENGLLLQPFENDKEKQILFEWLKFKKGISDAVIQHNESFADSEFVGHVITPSGEYVDTGDRVDIGRNKKLLEDLNLTPDNVNESYSISGPELFKSKSTDFLNSLIRVNNLFLKQRNVKHKSEHSAVNAAAMLSVMKEEGYKLMDESENPQQSIFDRNGKMREGYYVVQGASEEMITHKSQIILNRFNKSMDRLLRTKKKAQSK